jgi:hypothetical protein
LVSFVRLGRDCDGNELIDIIKTGNISISNSTDTSTKMYFNTFGFSFSENTDTVFTAVGDDSNFVSADYTGNGELDYLVVGRVLPFTQLLFSASLLENSGNLTLTENTTTGIL